jgi:uncharacterized membrane protein
MKKWLFCLIFILSLDLVSASTIYGNVYDLELNKLDNVILTINSQPIQKQVVKNSFYSFSIEQGNYIIKAKQVNSDLSTSENITINKEGNYSFDLFLTPGETELTNNTTTDNKIWLYFIPIIVLMSLIILIILFKRKKKNTEIEYDLTTKLLEKIKKNNGRITQKELRKEFPLSEAKISLAITELEHKNKVEKIKRGRTNVIILKK